MTMRKIHSTTFSGSDSLAFYMESKPAKSDIVSVDQDHVTLVHMDLWEDMDSSAVETHGRYNVQVGTVCVRGFESYCDAGNEQGWNFIGQSVHDSLRSCGFKVSVRDFGGWTIEQEDGTLVAGSHREAILIVAECMWTYGAKEVTSDESGNNLRTLMRNARRSV